KVAVGQAGADLALVELDGPQDPGHAADPLEVRVGQARHLVDVADLVVHDPDVGVADVEDLARRALHDAQEDRQLLGHQQGGEGDAEDQAVVLAPVAGEHLHRDPVHRPPPFRSYRARHLPEPAGDGEVPTYVCIYK